MTQTVPRFLQRYKGVEGYYFINRNADLGYIRAADAKPVKENFPQLHDRKFMRAHPDFVQQLETFLRDLQEMSYLYLNTAETGMELGYILPANSPNHVWRSSTLVMHKHVIDSMRKDEEKRRLEADQASPSHRTVDAVIARRSVHRGLNTLLDHRTTEGEHKYFPVLFFHGSHLSNAPEKNKILGQSSGYHDTSLRVLNLLWRRHRDGGRLYGMDVMFDLLRANVKRRSALDLGGRIRAGSRPVDRVLAGPGAESQDPGSRPTQLQ